MPYTLDTARNIFPSTKSADGVPATSARFEQLSVEDQLALIWFAYLEMGNSITVAAPGAANMQFAELTLDKIKKMTHDEQNQVMFDLAKHADTEISRQYAVWSPNLKLGFWYRLGEWMNDGIVAPIPKGYKLSSKAEAVLEAIKALEPGQQITVLRSCVVEMGYDKEKLGSYESIAEPIALPTSQEKRTKVKIEGVTNETVISYMDNLNANDFDALIELFTSDGALQPPFRKPLVGKDAVLKFFREECQNLKLIPECGIAEAADEGYTQVKVTGKCETPWFGAGVGMNIAWRFLLNDTGKIFFVAIDLLASPKELFNLIR